MKLDRMKMVGGDIADISVPNVSTLPVDVSENELLGHQGGLRLGKNDNWTTIHTKRNGVGPQQLIGGDASAGFLGEVAADELISGNSLSDAIGLYSGTSQFSNAGWLKFSYKNKVLYYAKKPLRYGLSWDSIDAVGAVFGEAEVVIDGVTFKVRLPSGSRYNPALTSPPWGYDLPTTHGSEWNSLMYHIASGVSISSSDTLESEGITDGDWARYSDRDLHVHTSLGHGTYSWCQEEQGAGTGAYISRGCNGVSDMTRRSSTTHTDICGWRPVLELVQ